MKKSIIKTLSVLMALILVLCTFPLAAFAVVSETFFLARHVGYNCTGSGTLASHKATAKFNATVIPLEPSIHEDMCSCEVKITGYGTTGMITGSTTTYGTISASATYIPSGILKTALFEFSFTGADMGDYTLTIP